MQSPENGPEVAKPKALFHKNVFGQLMAYKITEIL